MKALLLVLLASGPLMTPANPDPKPANAFWPYCAYNQTYSATYYYEYPGGPQCGVTYTYCLHDGYHEGCTTGYYSEWYNQCECQ
jgi:hypothetical protein